LHNFTVTLNPDFSISLLAMRAKLIALEIDSMWCNLGMVREELKDALRHDSSEEGRLLLSAIERWLTFARGVHVVAEAANKAIKPVVEIGQG
jgi:hypothetical protein